MPASTYSSPYGSKPSVAIARTTASHRHPLRVVTMWLASKGGFSSAGADDGGGGADTEAMAAEWAKMESNLKAQHARKGAAELSQILTQARHDFDRIAARRREKARTDQEAADASADSMAIIERELFTRDGASADDWAYVQKHSLNATLSKLLGLLRVHLPLRPREFLLHSIMVRPLRVGQYLVPDEPMGLSETMRCWGDVRAPAPTLLTNLRRVNDERSDELEERSGDSDKTN